MMKLAVILEPEEAGDLLGHVPAMLRAFIGKARLAMHGFLSVLR